MNASFIQVMKKGSRFRISLALVAWLTLCGCASISDHTQAYLGTPRYAPVDPGMVRVLNAAPSRPFERLGEIMLSADGNPSREQLEARLRVRAAGLATLYRWHCDQIQMSSSLYICNSPAAPAPIFHFSANRDG